MKTFGVTVPVTLRRAFSTVPTRAEQQTGVVIVGILFGLVISQLAADLASQIVAGWRGEPFVEAQPGVAVEPIARSEAFTQRDVVISHLLVAITLTITSAIGYYTSVNLPRLSVRFFNKAFFQFALDVSMVLTYYFVLEYAESDVDEASARPEAFLTFIAFGLYVVWDLLSWRSSADALDQLALGRRPRWPAPFGYRRRVTLGFFLLALALWAATLTDAGAGSDTTVIAFDAGLIGVLLAYRLCKVLKDTSIEYRGDGGAPAPDLSPIDRELVRSDVERVLPASVAANLDLIDQIATEQDEGLQLATDDGPRRVVVDALVADGAVTPMLDAQGHLRLKLRGPGIAAANLRLRDDEPHVPG